MSQAQRQAVHDSCHPPTRRWRLCGWFGMEVSFTAASLLTVVPSSTGPGGATTDPWLNDEIVDSYMALSVREHNDRVQANDPTARVSIFMPCAYGQGMVSRSRAAWLQYFRNYPACQSGVAWMETQAIFFPMNRGGAHWYLVVALPADRKLFVLDSSQDRSSMQRGARVVRDFLVDAKICAQDWTIDITQPGVQQDNIDDCGVFVCFNTVLYLTHLAGDALGPSDILPSQMRQGRLLIAHALVEAGKEQPE